MFYMNIRNYNYEKNFDEYFKYDNGFILNIF